MIRTGCPNTSAVGNRRITILDHRIRNRKIPVTESIPVDTTANAISSIAIDVVAVLNCEVVEYYVEDIAGTARIQYRRGEVPSIDCEYFVIRTAINNGGRCRCAHNRHRSKNFQVRKRISIGIEGPRLLAQHIGSCRNHDGVRYTARYIALAMAV